MTLKKVVHRPAHEQIPEIMRELQAAADTLQEVGWGVSVFGSARIKPGSRYYAIAEQLGQRLAEAGLPLIAGGGPGIMEAANKGAYTANGTSIGLNIKLPHETTNNQYQTHSLQFEYFYSRKATFFMHSAAYIALPGGFGTLDELFEVLTLVQTKKVPPAPIILVGKAYWDGLFNWVEEQLSQNGYISPGDSKLAIISDDIDEIIERIMRFYDTNVGGFGKTAIFPE